MTYAFKLLIPATALPASLTGGVARSAAANCAGLQSMQLPDTTISLAQSYAKGDAITATAKDPVDLCRAFPRAWCYLARTPLLARPCSETCIGFPYREGGAEVSGQIPTE